MACALFHHRQYFFVVAAFGVEQAIGGQPRPREAGREQVAPAQRPEHLTAFSPRHGEARGERGEKQGRGRLVIGRRRGRRGLVQPPGQPAPRQPFVHLPYAERQARPLPSGGTGMFDPAHLRAQGGEARIHGG